MYAKKAPVECRTIIIANSEKSLKNKPRLFSVSFEFEKTKLYYNLNKEKYENIICRRCNFFSGSCET